MPISDEFQIVFVHIPKNAGTSLENTLHARESGHRPWTHYAQTHPKEWNQYTSLAVIRDPIERFISSYNYARMKKSFWHTSIPGDVAIYGKHPDYDLCTSTTIDDVVTIFANNNRALGHPGWLPQSIWIDKNGSPATDYLASFPKLKQAISELAPRADLEHLNKSNVHQGTRISDESIATLKKLYQADVELYALVTKSGRALISTKEIKRETPEQAF